MLRNNIEKLLTLVQSPEEFKQKEDALFLKDKISHLSEAKKNAWKKLLSSIMTTESLENTVMDNIKKGFLHKREMIEYFDFHQRDERFHADILKKYIFNSFDYSKTKRTLSDKVIYDFIFPKMFKMFSNKPLYGLTIILFFEIFSSNLYRMIKHKAKEDDLIELHKIIDQIEKDEHKHIVGVNLLLDEIESEVALSILDRFCIRFLILVAVADLNMKSYAIHNKNVRNNMKVIGLNPDEVSNIAISLGKQILRKINIKSKINLNKEEDLFV